MGNPDTLTDDNVSNASKDHAYQIFAQTVDLLERSYPSQHGAVKLALFQPLGDYAVASPHKLAFKLFDRVFAAAGAEFKRTSTDVEIVALPLVYDRYVAQAMLFVAGRYTDLRRWPVACAWFKAAAELAAMAQGFTYDEFVKEHANAVAVYANHLLVELCRP